MKNGSRSLGLDAALIVLLTAGVYLPTMGAGFVYDDHGLITQNRMVKASDGLYRFWFTAEAPDYRPLTWSLWWLEWRLWDGRPAGYHVVNVLLHAVNAVLVWLILRRLNPANAAWAGPGAWLAAMVFAIHPVNVATVAWISEQKNTLSMLFYALSILLYLRFDEDGGWRWYGWSLTAFLLALLSKTAVVMLPMVLLGCVWWRHGRVRRRDWLCTVPYFVASLVLSLVTIVQHQRALVEPVQAGGFAARLARAGWMPWFYLSKALVPVNLMLFYPKWEVDASRWISYVPGTILIGCLVVFWWKRQSWGRPLLFGLGYFVVMLFPVLGFFDQYFYVYSWVADHWQYYSIVGVIALAVAGGQKLGNRMGEWGRYGALAAGVAVLVVLGAATWRRGFVYANDETLWRDNVTRNPNAWVAHNNLGFALKQAGRIREAIGHYEQALRLKPDFAEAHNHLGLLLSEVGKIDEAMAHYEQALRLKPDYAEAQNNLARLLATLAPADGGDPIRAVTLARQACESTDHRVAAYLDTLAAAYAAVGRFNDAVATAQKAIERARSAGQPQIIGEIEGHLQLYRSGRAYRRSIHVTSPARP